MSLQTVQQDRDDMRQCTTRNISILLGGCVELAARAKKSSKGKQGIERIVRWLGNSVLKLAEHGATLTNGQLGAPKLLSLVTARLKVIPTASKAMPYPDTSTPHRPAVVTPCPVIVSKFLSLDHQCIKRASQVAKVTSMSNRRGVQRLVSWIADIIIQIVSLYKVKNLSTSRLLDPKTLLNWVAHRAGVVPCKLQTLEVTGAQVTTVKDVVDVDVLVRVLLQRWKRQVWDGMRREAIETLSMLVRATKNARVTLPKIAAHLAKHKVQVDSLVVRSSKTWRNPGTSRHARERGTVVEIEDDVATCVFEHKELAYDVIHSKWECMHEVSPSKLRVTTGTKCTKIGGNNKSKTFKSGSPIQVMIDNSWIDGEILGKTTRRFTKEKYINISNLQDVRNAYVSDHAVKMALSHCKRYRPDESLPPVLERQYAVILPATLDHFEKWILSPARTEPMKMREKTVAAGHILGLKTPKYSSWKRYEIDCHSQVPPVVPLPRDEYTRILGTREFVKLKQDDCVCAKCLSLYWTGLVEQAPAFFKLMGKLGCVASVWTKETDPSTRLAKRMETASTHLRTTYGQHLQQQDEIADHCYVVSWVILVMLT